MRKLKLQELNRVSLETYKKESKSPLVIVLDNIRSLHNIGSAFRTADAFKIESIKLCGITAKPPHREIHKTALGATDSVTWKYYEKTKTAIEELKLEGFEIIAAEQTSESTGLQSFMPQSHKKYAIIFGHEVKGVSDEVLPLIDHCIEIPQYGTKHSFNVSVSIGIIVWDIFCKMQLHE